MSPVTMKNSVNGFVSLVEGMGSGDRPPKLTTPSISFTSWLTMGKLMNFNFLTCEMEIIIVHTPESVFGDYRTKHQAQNK